MSSHEEYEEKKTGGCGDISSVCLRDRLFDDLSDVMASGKFIQEQ